MLHAVEKFACALQMETKHRPHGRLRPHEHRSRARSKLRPIHTAIRTVFLLEPVVGFLEVAVAHETPVRAERRWVLYFCQAQHTMVITVAVIQLLLAYWSMTGTVNALTALVRIRCFFYRPRVASAVNVTVSGIHEGLMSTKQTLSSFATRLPAQAPQAMKTMPRPRPASTLLLSPRLAPPYRSTISITLSVNCSQPLFEWEPAS